MGWMAVKATCAMCGWSGDVDDEPLRMAPVLAFFNPKFGRRKYYPEVWVCDVCASKIRD